MGLGLGAGAEGWSRQRKQLGTQEESKHEQCGWDVGDGGTEWRWRDKPASDNEACPWPGRAFWSLKQWVTWSTLLY